MRIIFAGTPAISAAVLRSLVERQYNVVAVYTQPDRKAGRGKKLQASPVKELACELGIPVLQPISLKSGDSQQQLAQFNADLMVVIAYGLLLPKAVLTTPKFGCINVHASLLPRWRGAAPIERAIEAGDQETGITMMQMDEGLDTGDMLSVHRVKIDSNTTGDSLRDQLTPLAAEATIQCIDAIAAGTVTATPQKHDDANYANKLSKEEGLIDWSLPASLLERRIRAFCSSNVCYTIMSDQQRLKIWSAVPQSCLSEAKAGTIIAVDADGIVVRCGEQALKLTRIQLPGAKAMQCADLLRGRPDCFVTGQVLGAISTS